MRRKRKVIVAAGEGGLPLSYVATALKNLEPLGYTCTPALAARLATLPEAQLAKTYRQIASVLRKLRGARSTWAPMYPNFPGQVMAASEAELYWNALVHYAGDGMGVRIMPIYPVAPRAPLTEPVELVQIGLGSEAELVTLTRDLNGAATSLSPADRHDLARLIEHFAAQVGTILPAEIPHKENFAFVASLLIDHEVGSDVLLTRYVTTATDVLRLAVALSGDDVSLAKPTKFTAIARATRRLLVSPIERLPAPDQDLWRHPQPWLRLAERLHPGELAKRYPKAAAAFARRRGRHAGAAPGAVSLRAPDLARGRPADLSERPDGEGLRAAEHAAGAARGPVRRRGRGVRGRAHHAVSGAAVARALLARSRARGLHGPVLATVGEQGPADDRAGLAVADAACADAAVLPVVEGRQDRRQADGSRRHRSVGGRVPRRLQPRRPDPWTSLRSGKFKGAHSGDITSAPDGACEFIDLELASVKRAGGRYIVPVVFSFTAHPFCDLPECLMGWMGRRHPGSGEIVEPATVTDRLDLASDQRIAIPAIFDLETAEMIWVDAAYRARPETAAMAETHTGSIESLLRAMTALHVTSLHRLFALHIAARGTAVVDRGAAETVFSAEESPFDVEAIMARYLAS